jgi:hypothetical protein
VQAVEEVIDAGLVPIQSLLVKAGLLLRGEQDEKRASIRMRQCRRRRDQRRA